MVEHCTAKSWCEFLSWEMTVIVQLAYPSVASHVAMHDHDTFTWQATIVVLCSNALTSNISWESTVVDGCSVGEHRSAEGDIAGWTKSKNGRLCPCDIAHDGLSRK